MLRPRRQECFLAPTYRTDTLRNLMNRWWTAGGSSVALGAGANREIAGFS